jgi:hypothetical protein
LFRSAQARGDFDEADQIEEDIKELISLHRASEPLFRERNDDLGRWSNATDRLADIEKRKTELMEECGLIARDEGPPLPYAAMLNPMGPSDEEKSARDDQKSEKEENVAEDATENAQVGAEFVVNIPRVPVKRQPWRVKAYVVQHPSVNGGETSSTTQLGLVQQPATGTENLANGNGHLSVPNHDMRVNRMKTRESVRTPVAPVRKMKIHVPRIRLNPGSLKKR